MRCVHEKHFATCPECKAGEFEKQRDLAAEDGVEAFSAMEDCYGIGFKEGANWCRRYMLESDPVIAKMANALHCKDAYYSGAVGDANREFKTCGECDQCDALAAFAKERGEL